MGIASSHLKQRKALVSNVLKFWDSLNSHLPYVSQRNKALEGTRKFHVETSIEYCEDMLKALRALR